MLDKIALCKCGCGLPAPLAPYSILKRGIVKGGPLDFIHGHNRKKKIEYKVDPLTECWNWVLAIKPNGYGSLNGSLAHRVYYKRYKGQIPAGLQLDHLCRNRGCVNPDHLEAVTGATNIQRSPTAKLPRYVVEAILRSASIGRVDGKGLAAQYGVTTDTIQNVISGRTWKGTSGGMLNG